MYVKVRRANMVVWMFVFLAAIRAGIGLAQDVEASAAARYFLGVAKVDISPQHPVLLSGYAARPHELTQNVVQPLFARALVIGDEAGDANETFASVKVLIAVDNCAVHAAIRKVVASELLSEFGIVPANLTIASSHTHSGPMLSGALGNLLIRDQTAEEQAACDRYTQQLIQHMVEVTRQALAARRWVTLQRNQGEVDFAINRRGGQVVDHHLPLLVALDEQQQPTLLMTNYACHCVAAGSGLEICGDWAGFASQAMEKANPTATALVLIGCGADQNPAAMGSLAAAQQQGEQLAAKVQELLAKPKQSVTGKLKAKFAELQLPLDTLPSREEWEHPSREPGIIGYHAQKNLRRLAAGETLPTSIDYPIQTWTFGSDLALTFLGGEVVVDYVHLLRQRIDPERLWVTAYANDVPCYIPSRRILREGGYEGGDAMVWYDLPARLTEATESLILDEVQSQLGPTFAPTYDATRTGGTWPKCPPASLDCLITHPEFRIELVASEPLIRDPVAIDFGPDGRLWVAQMHDYPEGLDGQYQAGGSIQVLSDSDGDGHYDTAITFLDQLPFPTDVKVWRDGVLICTAPDVLFARDTTGDGRADQVTKVLTGFETHNYQARVNSLTWGLDHWVYGAAGIFGGQVKNSQGNETDLNNRDFRFNPDTGVVEAVSGRSQQGRVRDDWGNWFGCDNGSLLFHYPSVEHYARRNPAGPTPPAVVSVTQSSRLFPPAQIVQWALSGPKGLPTAACGLGFMRSDLLGNEYSHNAFTCEPVNQLVHRQQLQPNGVTFKGLRGANEQDREFLWSTDQWFRPVQAKTGLDGALYVVDMYRFLIEHPRFLPDDVRAQVDVRAGHDRGRIYRVVPKSREVPPPALREDLSKMTAVELVRELDTTNGARRDLVHQLLWWHVDPQNSSPEVGRCIEELQQLFPRSDRPAVRVQVLSLLAQWNCLPEKLLQAALSDPQAVVRRHAVRVAEARLQESSPSRSGRAKQVVSDEDELPAEWLGRHLLAMVDDPDPQVRLQVAYSLGQWNDPQTSSALDRLLDRDGNDPWITGAAYSSLTPENLKPLLELRLAVLEPNDQLSDSLRQLVRQSLAMSDTAVKDFLLKQADQRTSVTDASETPTTWQVQLWILMAESATSDPSKHQAYEAALRHGLEIAIQHTLHDLSARSEVGTFDPAARVVQMELLGWARDAAQVIPVLQQELRPQSTADMQKAALTAWARLARTGEPSLSESFCLLIPELTPLMQNHAVQLAQANPPLTTALLAAIEGAQVPANLLDAAARQLLHDHPDQAVQQVARRLFAESPTGPWREKFPQYQGLDAAQGDAQKGQVVFRQHCASCHRADDVGYAVGPDLRALADLSTPGLLAAILDPNAAVDARYAAYIALTTDGQVVSGLLESESSNSVTLLGQEGKRFQLLRSEIEALQRTGKSLMPEGLEKEISPLAMQDLLRYLGAGASQIRYEYTGPRGAHPTYPDSNPPGKLTNRHFGTGRFDDGQWVSFYHVDQPQYKALFDLGTPVALSRIRVTYGVNHRPGVIHAPRVMRIRLTTGEDSEAHEIQVDDWDDAPDGLGPYQIDRRSKLIEFPTVEAQYVELAWESDYEWTLFSEVEFNPDLETDAHAVPSSADAPSNEEHGTMPAEPPAKTGVPSVDRMLALVALAKIGTPDEYRVIPEIWRESIEAGKRNEPAEILAMLDAALPHSTEPLWDWQAVVIGGGIINGISQAGPYPGSRINKILADNAALTDRFQRSLLLAAEMVDRETTPQGTRYDALRMIALRPWEEARQQLSTYLQPGTPQELQQGSVSGLVDVPESAAALMLHGALSHLPPDLQSLAIEGLVRDQPENGLRSALERGKIEVLDLHPSLRAKLKYE